MVEHHPLREQFGERLIHRHQIHVTHDFGPKSGVQQMQNCMFNAANVLVHATSHPVLRAVAYHGVCIVWVAVAHEIPRRVHEGIHGVCFAFGRLGACWATDVQKRSRFVQRVAAAVRHKVLRQDHGQVFFWHRHCAAVVAVNDGDRRAPVTLAADAPVAQTPRGLLVTQAFVV